jgi:hypothetical protein
VRLTDRVRGLFGRRRTGEMRSHLVGCHVGLAEAAGRAPDVGADGVARYARDARSRGGSRPF